MAGKRFSIKAIIEGVDRMSRPWKRMERNVEAGTKRVKKAIGSLTWGLGGLTKHLGFLSGAGAVAGLYATAKAFMSVEDAIAKVASLPGVTEDAITSMHKAGIAWSEAHGTSVEDYLGTAYEALSAGITDTDKVIAATETAQKVATATFVDSSSAMRSVAKLYNNIGDKAAPAADEMQRMGDILTATQQTFQLKDLEQLADGLRYAVPYAKTFGVSIEQTAAAIGQLNTRGLDGASAGTAFRAALAKMSEASEKLGFDVVNTADGGIDLNATLWNLNEAVKKIDPTKLGDRLQDAFGTKGMAFAALLRGDVVELEKFATSLRETAGWTDRAFNRIDSTSSSKLRALTQRLRNAGAEIGRKLVPMVEQYLPQIISLIEKIPAAFAWVSQTVSDVARFVDSIGGVKTVLEGIAAIKLVGFMAALGPIPALIGGIAASIGAVIWAIERAKALQAQDKANREAIARGFAGAAVATGSDAASRLAARVRARAEGNVQVGDIQRGGIFAAAEATGTRSRIEDALIGATAALRDMRSAKMAMDVTFSGLPAGVVPRVTSTSGPVDVRAPAGTRPALAGAR